MTTPWRSPPPAPGTAAAKLTSGPQVAQDGSPDTAKRVGERWHRVAPGGRAGWSRPAAPAGAHLEEAPRPRQFKGLASALPARSQAGPSGRAQACGTGWPQAIRNRKPPRRRIHADERQKATDGRCQTPGFGAGEIRSEGTGRPRTAGRGGAQPPPALAATHSISTCAPSANPFTPSALRAGKCLPKKPRYASLNSLHRAMSASITVHFTRSSMP